MLICLNILFKSHQCLFNENTTSILCCIHIVILCIQDSFVVNKIGKEKRGSVISHHLPACIDQPSLLAVLCRDGSKCPEHVMHSNSFTISVTVGCEHFCNKICQFQEKKNNDLNKHLAKLDQRKQMLSDTHSFCR